MESPGKTP